MTSQLVVDELMITVRRGKPLTLRHHSDEESQDTRYHFQQLLEA